MKKIVILITDGKQNPKRYDPVAASQKLYNDKVNIYAVGIGNTVDFNQLKRITRHPHRVFAARDFKSLSNEEFVKNVTETSCHKGETPIEKPTDGIYFCYIFILPDKSFVTIQNDAAFVQRIKIKHIFFGPI